jgi:hypothetical protein
MEPVFNELYEVVSDSLYEMTWHCGYPIHPNIGLWAVLEAFKTREWAVDFDGKQARIATKRFILGREHSLETTVDVPTLLKGWSHEPQGAPRAMYLGILTVYDRLGEHLKGEERNAWQDFRQINSRHVRDELEAKLKPFFPRYQEHMLVPVSGELPKLEPPSLFEKQLATFSEPLYRAARIVTITDSTHFAPCPETMLEQDETQYDPNAYHPHESTMIELFWGQYLNELVKIKGYKVEYPSNPLRQLVASGFKALQPGYFFWDKKP